MPRTVKVAVVGSGLAGLTAAHLLGHDPQNSEVRFEVHLFEKVSIKFISTIPCLLILSRHLHSEWTPRLYQSRCLVKRVNGGLSAFRDATITVSPI
jgi:flavin-dependent dehydrogenase